MGSTSKVLLCWTLSSVGGGIGVWAGAGAGFVFGGPPGAVIGGFIGYVGGSVAGGIAYDETIAPWLRGVFIGDEFK